MNGTLEVIGISMQMRLICFRPTRCRVCENQSFSLLCERLLSALLRDANLLMMCMKDGAYRTRLLSLIVEYANGVHDGWSFSNKVNEFDC